MTSDSLPRSVNRSAAQNASTSSSQAKSTVTKSRPGYTAGEGVFSDDEGEEEDEAPAMEKPKAPAAQPRFSLTTRPKVSC